MIEEVRDYWARSGFSPLCGPVLTGFSGGPDSTALVMVLQALGVEQRVVHFDHELRSDSGGDAAWCESFCAGRELKCEVFKLAVPLASEPGESVEMAARRLRLEAWRQLSDEMGGVPVLLGHHEDDAVETMLMRMLRGANSSGSTGLRPRRVVAGVELWRPLLGVSRKRIEAYLAESGVTDTRADLSNLDPAFLRNRVRHELLPLLRELGSGDAGLRRTAQLLLADAEVLEGVAVGERLTVTALRAAPEVLRLRMLRMWAAQTGAGELLLSAGAAGKLHQLLRHQGGGRRRIELDDGRWLVFERDRVGIEARGGNATDWEPLLWNWRDEPELVLPTGDVLRAEILSGAVVPENGGACCFAASALPAVLAVRPRREGERMVPFGGSEPVRVKKLLANTGLSLAGRSRAALVTAPDTGEVLWLAPFRRGVGAPVTDGTLETGRLRLVPCR
jgi:tRNA(Ile)-lysidine synthase